MDLSPKAIRFLLDALTCYDEHLARRLEAECVSEDEAADVDNDRRYLQALREDLQARHDKSARDRPMSMGIAK